MHRMLPETCPGPFGWAAAIGRLYHGEQEVEFAEHVRVSCSNYPSIESISKLFEVQGMRSVETLWQAYLRNPFWGDKRSGFYCL